MPGASVNDGDGVGLGEGLVPGEGLEGTDAMLRRVKELHESGRARWRGQSGVVAKWSKPQQDLRVDMPVMGARTIEMAAAAGLAGVGGVAGKLILIDKAELIEAADRAGLFVWGEAGGSAG